MGQENITMCHQYDTLRATVFLHLLEKNKINTEGIVILHPECSTGVLSAKLAERCAFVVCAFVEPCAFMFSTKLAEIRNSDIKATTLT